MTSNISNHNLLMVFLMVFAPNTCLLTCWDVEAKSTPFFQCGRAHYSAGCPWAHVSNSLDMLSWTAFGINHCLLAKLHNTYCFDALTQLSSNHKLALVKVAQILTLTDCTWFQHINSKTCLLTCSQCNIKHSCHCNEIIDVILCFFPENMPVD